ncbi:helix-turn-helix transcriptional regulator, partial [Enterorhabdus sp. P55]|uniref:helix-turn-helix transcriptional regulator n=1 Tax=Enterorhabdus sp. P55 TaxID=2304571 RepID=UPI001F3CC1FD
MNVEIAERLAARRKQAGLSQEALAEKLGVSRQAVSKWERSESSPDTDNLIALARLYGVSLDELLYVDDSIADDVAFEAEDRAAAGTAGAGAAAGATGAASAGGP